MKYVAIQPLWANLLGARLKPTAAQLQRLQGLVGEPDKKGFVEVVKPFQIKVGEEFELDGPITKGMTDSVETSASKAARDKAAALAADKEAAAVEAQRKAEAAAEADRLAAAEAARKAAESSEQK